MWSNRQQFKYLLASVCIGALISGCNNDGGGGASTTGLVTGQGGSTARMVLDGDYLYAISGSDVQLFDVKTNPEAPNPWVRVNVDWQIETLFPHGNYLLVGAANGVHILDNSDRASPTLVGEFTHATARDPVVAQDTLAYVTLKRDFTQPGTGAEDQLNVLDISDITNPQLIKTLSLQAPEGLAVYGDRLHVCDGEAGLKTFDLTDPRAPKNLHVVPDVNCRDLVRTKDLLTVISTSGLQQFDMTTGVPLLLSEIPTEPVIYRTDR